jgi:hypothetical protein
VIVGDKSQFKTAAMRKRNCRDRKGVLNPCVCLQCKRQPRLVEIFRLFDAQCSPECFSTYFAGVQRICKYESDLGLLDQARQPLSGSHPSLRCRGGSSASRL